MVRMSLPSQNYNFIKVRSPCEFKVCQRTNIFNAYIYMNICNRERMLCMSREVEILSARGSSMSVFCVILF